MDNAHALRIVAALANGTHPLTGEIFSPESPYQTPDVIRALYAAVRALESEARLGIERSQESGGKSDRKSDLRSEGKVGNAPRNGGNGNAGKPWSADEDKQLLEGFDAGKSIAELAQAHARTHGGIRARLEKHGRLEPSPATRWQSGKRSEIADRAAT